MCVFGGGGAHNNEMKYISPHNKEKGRENKKGDCIGRHYGRGFHSQFLSHSMLLYSLNQNPSYAYIYMSCLSRFVPLSRSFAIMRGKTKKSDSSFCRGPLMISLKWLTALNSNGNLLQSKQIWSVLETEPGGSLGEGCNMSLCMCVKRGEVEEGGSLMRETSGGHTGSMGSTAAGRCPPQTPSTTRKHPPSLTSIPHLIPSVPRSF